MLLLFADHNQLKDTKFVCSVHAEHKLLVILPTFLVTGVEFI